METRLYNSTITGWILTKNVSFKREGNNMRNISSKQEEEFRATTFVVNILFLRLPVKLPHREVALTKFGEVTPLLYYNCTAF